jgi:hypothetical protein
VPASVLAERLLALNRVDAPYSVARGSRPQEYFLEWRLDDERWLDAMRVRGQKTMHRIVLHLDQPARTVRAMDRESALRWSAGGQPILNLRWSRKYGIKFFHREAQLDYGLIFSEGMPKLTHRYSYRFHLDELKGPAIQLVTASGWTYRPVVTFWRFLGG